jgi:molybdopterin molybdotransferase
VDYARVRFDGPRVEPLSVAGASVLSSTTRADGFVVVPEGSEGFPAGAEVEVWLYA